MTVKLCSTQSNSHQPSLALLLNLVITDQTPKQHSVAMAFDGNVSVNTHGSAAGTTIPAALPPPAAGHSLSVQPVIGQALVAAAPFLVAGNRIATESLGNTGEYQPMPPSPNHGRPRRTNPSVDSALGAELRDPRSRSRESSDDTLIYSPEVPAGRQAGPMKRGSRSAPGS